MNLLNWAEAVTLRFLSSFIALPELLTHSDFIATAPARLLQHSPELFVCEPPLPIMGFTKLLAWYERTHHSEAFKWLREKMGGSSGVRAVNFYRDFAKFAFLPILASKLFY